MTAGPLDPEAFRSERAARAIVERIRGLATAPAALMEVCGTHTVAISRFGLRSLLPERLRLLSGPGCPVCVTPVGEIDRAIAIARLPDTIVATFGDMMRVPGSESSLERERARGADVRIVYSPLDALEIAAEEPGREIVFLGVGFETTSPTVAATIARADREGLRNVSVLPFFKRIPPALRKLAAVPDRSLDGFICPGHVSVVLGSDAYRSIARDDGLPCVVTGFEPLDILWGIFLLLRQANDVRAGGRAKVEIQYRRAVTREGNPAALAMLDDVFEICDAEWRGIGEIPESGYAIAEPYRNLDAGPRFDVELPPPADDGPCICGEIMLGEKLPDDCPSFGTACTPRSPLGPCMVSSEGSCAAFYRYERGRRDRR